jgi:hypothetical protein
VSQKIYFITYGTSPEYDISKKHLVSLIKYSELFEKAISYDFKDIDNDFIQKYEKILTNKRGGGYWLWKINIIRQTLETIKKNDLLLYMDAGSSFNIRGKKRFLEYIELLNHEQTIGNFRFESEKHHIEKEWTSKELFSYFDINLESPIATSTQYEAGHLLIKNNDHTEELLNNFLEAIDYDPNFITDEYNKTRQIENFKECRHDQSILSLLSKKMGCVSVENETDFRLRKDIQYNYPILAVRKKGHKKKDRLKYKIFSSYYKKRPVYF